MNLEIEEIRSCVRRKDIKAALSLIASLEGTSGLVAPLQVLKAICLQQIWGLFPQMMKSRRRPVNGKLVISRPSAFCRDINNLPPLRVLGPA